MASQRLFEDNSNPSKILSLDVAGLTGERTATFPDSNLTVAGLRLTDVDTSSSAVTETFDGVEGEIRGYRQAGSNLLTVQGSGGALFPDGGTDYTFGTDNQTALFTLKGSTIEVVSDAGGATAGGGSYTQLVGNGSSTSFVVTHNLGTQLVIVNIFDNATKNRILTQWTATSTNSITVAFNYAPTTNEFLVYVATVS